MKLDKKQIEHIANLARLELSDEEVKKYGGQLSGIFDYIEQLSEVNVEGVEPTAQVTGMKNILREDKVEVWAENEVEASLNQAPETEDHQIKVKRVLA
jgi:aspartyl-tRNA(Asn)/glutamyl-tRNA(Gln) amidotransferase subunit C